MRIPVEEEGSKCELELWTYNQTYSSSYSIPTGTQLPLVGQHRLTTEDPEVTDVHSCDVGQGVAAEQTINWPNSFLSGVPPLGHPESKPHWEIYKKRKSTSNSTISLTIVASRKIVRVSIAAVVLEALTLLCLRVVIITEIQSCTKVNMPITSIYR